VEFGWPSQVACHCGWVLSYRESFFFFIHILHLYKEICWQIVGLKASTNNKASTVLDVFLDTVAEYREWPGNGYPIHEFLKVGGGGKYLFIVLPFEICWWQAVKWLQGLDLMMKFSLEFEQ
jgi:hypothetical protein